MLDLHIQFLIGFLGYFIINLGDALIALLVGLVVGGAFGYLRTLSNIAIKGIVETFISLLRAFPVFVLMFALWNLMPHWQMDLTSNFITGADLVLIIALSAYSVAVLSDAIFDALEFHQKGDRERVWLLAPNVFRIFVVLVMSTSIGAAIGVKEAVNYSLVFSDGIPDRPGKIAILMLATVCFAAFFSVSKLMLDKFTQHIKHNGNRPDKA
jgi:ABC-type arginine/histidine transport system permease subunit